MPGPLIQQGAMVLCPHGGQAFPAAPNPRVTAAGGATAVITGPWTVAACPGVPGTLPPCITAQWTTGTTRVTSDGQPLVIVTGTAVTAPNGTPLIPQATQSRVTAT